MDKRYNMKNPGVKRLMREAMELKDPTPMYYTQPLEDNLFEWHFTILAPQGTDFEGGQYHGRILLPTEYPMKPPSIIMLTPNGRFEIHHKICLSASAYHPESWQPSWSIRTVLLALIGFMPTEGGGAIGSLDVPPAERRRLAQCSQEWVCPVCGVANKDILPPLEERQEDKENQDKVMAEAADIVSQMAFKSESEVKAMKKQQQQQQQSTGQRTPLSSSPPHMSQASPSSPPDATTSTSSPSTTSPRQRLHHPQSDSMVASHAANVSMVPPTVKRASIQTSPADMPQRNRGARFGSLVLIWILLLAISVLVIRRVYIMV